jgi:polar amino acid transport system ATP-binding protein
LHNRDDKSVTPPANLPIYSLAKPIPATPHLLKQRRDHMPDQGSTGASQPIAIRVSALRKSFGTHEVLKGVSLTAREGDVVAIIGGSGSGKSTMLRCVNFLETPSGGEIEIGGEKVAMRPDGTPSDRRQLERLRQSLGMVFQNFNLWTHKTVLENLIEVPVHVLKIPKAEAEARARTLLARVGLAEKEGAYPAFMSGGQQQRAAIARALAMNPKAMLFDEPTSALDPELVGEVLQVIKGLADEGRTMILVTHEMKFAREVASHVIYLHNGIIEEEGPPDQLFGAPKSDRLKQFLKTVG